MSNRAQERQTADPSLQITTLFQRSVDNIQKTLRENIADLLTLLQQLDSSINDNKTPEELTEDKVQQALQQALAEINSQ